VLERKVKLIYIHDLKPHESVCPIRFYEMLKDIKSRGILDYPLIVEKNSYVILDGTHRYNVLKVLKADFVPCYLVDYKDVNLLTWVRRVSLDANTILNILEKYGFRETFSNNYSFKIVYKNKTYNYRERGLRDDLLKLQNIIRDYIISYVPLDKFEESFSENYVYIVPKIPTKKEIINNALRNRLYPPKTTRHIVKEELPKINISLNELK